MLMHLNVLEIVKHQFSPYQYTVDLTDRFRPHRLDRRWSRQRLSWFAAFPLVLGGVLAYYGGPLPDDDINLVLAIGGLTSGVLTAALPLVHALISATQANKAFTLAETPLVKQTMGRVATLADLYTHVAFGIVLSVFALLPGVLLAVVPWAAVKIVLSGLIYAVGISMAFVMLQILSGLYLILDVDAEVQIRQVERNARTLPPEQPPLTEGHHAANGHLSSQV